MTITVEAIVSADPAEVWRAWTSPADVVAWNAASDEWHTVSAENDLRVGGRFSYRMEAKDGSAGFDFAGVYTAVVPHERIECVLGDMGGVGGEGRRLVVEFAAVGPGGGEAGGGAGRGTGGAGGGGGGGGGVRVRETFDADDTYPVEMQRAGWQAILDRFKRHLEG